MIAMDGDRTLEFLASTPLLVASLGFVDSLFNYFWPGNGIHGSAGALLVVISTLLMAATLALLAWLRIPRGLAIALQVLLVLDFLGTGFAAYLLEAWILCGLDLLAGIAWLLLTIRQGRPLRPKVS